MTTCLHARFSPSLVQQQAVQRMPWCACQCPRPQPSCSDTPRQLQRLPRAACAALADSSKPPRSASGFSQAGEEATEQLLEWSLEEQHTGSASQQQQSSAGQQQEQVSTPVLLQQQQQQSSPQQPKSNKEQRKRRDNRNHSQQAISVHANLISTAAGQSGAAQGRAAPATPPLSRGQSFNHQAKQHRRRQQQQQSMTDDDYAAAQQRVRQLLISADINDPQAVVDAIPDTVNDIVIALQVLATASKPPGLSAIKQYETAVQQLSAAVVRKLKHIVVNQQLLLQQQQRRRLAQEHKPSVSVAGFSSSRGSKQPADAAAEVVQSSSSATTAVEPSLAAALAFLPPTKLAATTFSLGVLRHYEEELVNALESATLHILQRSSTRGSSSSSNVPVPPVNGRLPKQGQQPSCKQSQQQQQQHLPLQSKLLGFNANQLGQLAQGFVYLDHQLHPSWQAAFLQACRQQLQFMNPPQLASLAVFTVHYRHLKQYMPGSTGSTTNLLPGSTTRLIINSSAVLPFSSSSNSVHLGGGRTATAAAIGLDVLWVKAYLNAVGQQASAFTPQQLVQVLQAAAGLCQQHLQHQQGKGGNRYASSSSGKTNTDAKVFGGVPMPMPTIALGGSMQMPGMRHTAGRPCRRNSSKGRVGGRSSSSSWLPPLLLAFQQQLPDMKMTHLADGLPALLQLTDKPWPQQLQQQVLLQVRLLLPAAAGPDIVTAVAAVAVLAGDTGNNSDSDTAGNGVSPANNAFCDALLQRLHALLPTLRPSELAGMIQTLALLRVKPYKAWLYELFARLRVEARFFTGHEVLAVIEGFAYLRVQLDPEVLHLFVIGVKRWMGALGSGELRRIVAALRRMYPRVLPGRTVALLVEELERRAALLELQMPSR